MCSRLGVFLFRSPSSYQDLKTICWYRGPYLKGNLLSFVFWALSAVHDVNQKRRSLSSLAHLEARGTSPQFWVPSQMTTDWLMIISRDSYNVINDNFGFYLYQLFVRRGIKKDYQAEQAIGGVKRTSEIKGNRFTGSLLVEDVAFTSLWRNRKFKIQKRIQRENTKGYTKKCEKKYKKKTGAVGNQRGE